MKVTHVISMVIVTMIMIGLAAEAFRSRKSIAKWVRMLLLSLLLPIAGHIIVALSINEVTARGGYVLFFMGIDLMLYWMIDFCMEYCGYQYEHTKKKKRLRILLFLDVFSMWLNPFFFHFFEVEKILLADGSSYYSRIGHWGYYVHVTFELVMVAIAFFVLIFKIYSTSLVYNEKYYAILAVEVATLIWALYYVLANPPINRSVLGYCLSGVLIWYFALHHKPVFLVNLTMEEIVSDLNEAIFFFDIEDNCIYINEMARKIFKLKEKDLDHGRSIINRLLGEAPEDDHFTGFSRECVVEEQGVEKIFDVSQHIIKDKHGYYVGCFYGIFDRTEEKQNQRMKLFKSRRDALTGIYNEQYFLEKCRERIDEHPEIDFLMVATNVKDFKLINDIYGHDAGDEILQKSAKVILDNVVDPITVYGRIGSDKFGVMMDKTKLKTGLFSRPAEALSLSKDLRYPVITHFGIYEITERDMDISVMIDRAQMAIQHIRDEYGRYVAYYDDTIREDIVWEKKITGDLEDALAEGQIVPYLQAQVNDHEAVEGAEVLVRWNHPTEGFLAPYKFIPIFEKSGMIARVDCYIWEEACKLLRKWQDQGIDRYLSVNISPKDFFFVDVYETITGLVKKYGIAPSKLRLEITETVMMTDMKQRIELLQKFRDAGFLIEMDDFGSGYSSLNMLKDMPVDILKIDMLFMMKTEQTERASKILQMIIHLADDLGIPSLTEGVETREQFETLSRMGCHLYQGYYFSKPIPVEEYESKF